MKDEIEYLKGSQLIALSKDIFPKTSGHKFIAKPILIGINPSYDEHGEQLSSNVASFLKKYSKSASYENFIRMCHQIYVKPEDHVIPLHTSQRARLRALAIGAVNAG